MIIHALTCTTRRTDNHQGQFTRLHAPTRKSHTLHASRTHMRPSSVMMSWWRHSPGQPHLTRSLDSIQTAWKKKKKGLTKFELWLGPKSQNFQNWSVPLGFLSTFRFWDPLLHPRLGNCTNGSVSKSWLLHKSWPKVNIFKKDLSCSIFRIDSDFGVHFFIWETEITQIVWFYNFWL